MSPIGCWGGFLTVGGYTSSVPSTPHLVTLWVPKTPSIARDLCVLVSGRRLSEGVSLCWIVLLRLPYLAVSSVFALMRLLPMSAVDKDIEILMLRHQLAVLRRQIDRPRVAPADRAFLAALLHRLPRPVLRRLHLIVSPDTVLRWHRDLMRRRHAEASPPQAARQTADSPRRPGSRPAPGP